MKLFVNLLSLSSCCLAIGIATANAEVMLLADAELDRVTAGACLVGSTNCNDTPGYGLFPEGFALLRPVYPGGPIPTEGPGCNTGGGPCDPSPFPSFEFVARVGFAPFGPLTFLFEPLGFGGGCVGGPAGACPTQFGPDNRPW